VVLVAIVTIVRQHQVRRCPFQRLENLFDPPFVRKEAVPETVRPYARAGGMLQEEPGTAARFLLPTPGCRKDDPIDVDLVLGEKRKDQAAAADFDIIRMGTEAQDS
jgi:hypothetical protein